jgi:hypothetical protein
MGIIGKRFVSDFSFEVSMKIRWAGEKQPQAGTPVTLPGLFQ